MDARRRAVTPSPVRAARDRGSQSTPFRSGRFRSGAVRSGSPLRLGVELGWAEDEG